MREFARMVDRHDGKVTDPINLICRGCREIMDYPVPVIVNFGEVVKKARFWVTDTRLDCYGY